MSVTTIGLGPADSGPVVLTPAHLYICCVHHTWCWITTYCIILINNDYLQLQNYKCKSCYNGSECLSARRVDALSIRHITSCPPVYIPLKSSSNFMQLHNPHDRHVCVRSMYSSHSMKFDSCFYHVQRML